MSRFLLLLIASSVAVGVLSALVAVFGGIFGPVIVGLIVVIPAVVVIGTWISKGIDDIRTRRTVVRIFLIGLLVRLAIAPIFYLLLVTFAPQGQPGIFFDDEKWYTMAHLQMGSTWPELWQKIPLQNARHTIYLPFIGAISLIFGDTNLVVRLFSAALAALVIPLTARVAFLIGREGQGSRLAVITAWVTALSPELILWSISVMREWMVGIALASVVLLCLESIVRARRVTVMIGIALGLGSLFLLREPTAFVMVSALAIWVAFSWLYRSGNWISIGGVVGVSIGGLAGMSWVLSQYNLLPFSIFSIGEWGNYLFQQYVSDPEAQLRVNASLTEQAGTFLGSSSHIWADPFNWGGRFTGWITASAKTILTPSPLWFPAVGFFYTAVFFLPGVFWYGLIPTLLLGVRSFLREMTPARSLVIIVVLFFFLLTISPYGLGAQPLRARVQLFPLLYIIAAQGILILQDHPVVRRSVILGFAGLYASVTCFYYLGRILPWPVLHPYSMAAIFMVLFGAAGFVLLLRRMGSLNRAGWRFIS